MHRSVPLGTSSLLFAAVHQNHPRNGWYLHQQVPLVNDRRELVDSVAAEDGIVWLYEVNNMKGYGFRPYGGILTEGHVDINLSQRLDFFVTEAI
jgi:hypothetical protein